LTEIQAGIDLQMSLSQLELGYFYDSYTFSFER
jgi:hypothetical protein